jgi:hypothetical protein
LDKPETYGVYLFAQSNPYVLSDPTGLFSFSSIGATISAAFSLVMTRIASFALFVRTVQIASNGLKRLQAARTVSAVALLSAQRKADILLDFMRRINFTIQGGLAKGVRDAGPYLEMISDDGRYAFRILKENGAVLYGRIDLQEAEYIWRQL